MPALRNTRLRRPSQLKWLGVGMAFLGIAALIGPYWWTSQLLFFQTTSGTFHEPQAAADLPSSTNKGRLDLSKDGMSIHATNNTTAADDLTVLRLALLDMWQQVVQKQVGKHPLNETRKRKTIKIPSSQFYSWVQSVEQANIWQSKAHAAGNMNTTSHQVCLATHGSMDRWEVIQRQILHWNGPVSLALYIARGPAEIETLLSRISRLSRLNMSIRIHVCMEAQVTRYPHNSLRELALHSIPHGSYWAAVDADFVPPRNIHERLQGMLLDSIVVKEVKDQKALLVLPALVWEGNQSSFVTEGFPDTRAEVLRLIANGTVGPFKPTLPSQQATNFSYWRTTDNRINSKNKYFYDIGIGSPGYEPFVVGYRGDSPSTDTLPHYWTGFRGWGRNKVSFNTELVLAGYTYRVMWDFFVLHMDRHPSKKKPSDNRRNMREWNEFLRPYLNETYQPQDEALRAILQ